MKTKTFSFLQFNRFDKFGDQVVSQFVVFECKYLFSIIFFYFHKCTGAQDRFHTHAFNALSFKLWGRYDEHTRKVLDINVPHEVRPRTSFFKYFRRDSIHRIANSTGCCTLLLSGPWKEKWLEWFENGETVEYSWGRNHD